MRIPASIDELALDARITSSCRGACICDQYSGSSR